MNSINIIYSKQTINSCNYFRKIPANSTLNDTTLAIQSLNGFIRLTYVTTVEHVHALDEFLTLNNLTVPQLIATIDMVVIIRFDFVVVVVRMT